MTASMKSGSPTYNDIDEYIAWFPPDIQKLLQQVRKTIREAAPDATEAIKYQLPTFVQNGNLVHFGAFKQHIGFYPTPEGIEAFREEFSRYDGDKGTVRLPIDEPLPLDLIRRVVEFRVRSNAQAAAAKRKGRRSSH